MKPETDIGIDLYCQLLKGDLPLPIYFGVQAKGTKHFNNYCYRYIKRSTINLWLQQPFPIFLVVYDGNTENCYWISIVHKLNDLIEKLQRNRKTISLRIDKSNVLEKGENKNDDFIKKIKEAQALLNLMRGQPTLFGEGYVQTQPPFRLSRGVITNLKDRIRISMNYLINNYLLANDIQQAYFLSDFLTKFDKSHYDHFVVFADINKLLGRRKEARWGIDEAIKICKRDTKWNKLKGAEYPTIEEIIASLEKEKENLEKD